jgi:hypothetical protein
MAANLTRWDPTGCRERNAGSGRNLLASTDDSPGLSRENDSAADPSGCPDGTGQRPRVTLGGGTGRGLDGTPLMTAQEIFALMRRHLVALMIVVVIAAGVAYKLKHTPIMYQESGTVALTAGRSAANPNPYVSLNQSMIDAAGVMVLLVMSPQGQEQVEAAGGSASFDVALVNSYSMQFPDYSAPYITVSVTSFDPAEVHRTFTVVGGFLDHELAVRQAQFHVSGAALIVPHMIADTGPLAQPGSSKRWLLGIFILTLVAAFSATIFLDRHPVRLRRLARFPADRPS